jgi:hypothetical protein
MKRITHYLFAVLLTFSSIGQSAFAPEKFFTPFQINSANTAKDTDYLTQDEKDIFLFNNLARMYPKDFYELYKAFVESNPNRAYLFTSNHYYKTLSEDLLNNAPAGPLMPDWNMFGLAECWANESGEKGIVGHDRITCKGGFSAENCSYGYSGALDIVMQLLIDHGVESLGHRRNMMNPGYKGLGVAIRPHAGYRFCAVQDFSSSNDEIRMDHEIERKAEEARQAEEAKKREERLKQFDIMWTKWTTDEKAAADVGRSLPYLTELEKDFYFHVNLIRMYPKKYRELIWQNGPYFDQFLDELKSGLHKEAGYLMVDRYLQLAVAKPALVPSERYINAGHCIADGFRNGQSNLLSCLNGGGSYQVQSFFEEDNYHDIMKFLMDEKTFQGLFNQGMTIAFSDGMKVMVK